MHISSKFRDYYDQVQALGHDESLTYRRYQEAIAVPVADAGSPLLALIKQASRAQPEFIVQGFDAVVVGFCGRLYLAAYPLPADPAQSAAPGPRPYLYDVAALHKLAPFLNEPQDISFYDSWGQDPAYSALGYYATDDAIFLALGVPVFVIDPAAAPPDPGTYVFANSPRLKDYVLTKNPCLKDYEFFRLFEAYAAYQEIEFYLGNTLLDNTMPTPPLADSAKITSHGFDPKMGFRKRKK